MTDFSKSMENTDRNFSHKIQEILDKYFLDGDTDSQSATTKTFDVKDIYAEWEKNGWIMIQQSPRHDSSIESC